MAYFNGVARSSADLAAKDIKKLAWLMFICGKQKILQGVENIAEMAYLLYACLYWTVMLCPKDVTCVLLESKLVLPIDPPE